jgi:uncharacterized membrane protein (UPF0127 family)
MNRRTLLAGLALLPACAVAQVNPTAAQAELPKEKLTIVTRDGVKHDFTVEMATTPQEQEIGLMFRPAVPPDGGMLFDWGHVRDSTMWMRNTLAPLDMLFINPDGTIHHIAEDTTPQSLAIIPSGGAVRATLEVAAGTAARLHLRVGDKVEQRIFGNQG